MSGRAKSRVTVENSTPEERLHAGLALVSPAASRAAWDEAFRMAGVVKEDRPRVPWSPLPGPQTQAHECEADEIGYGGAAGGGKTDLGIGTALQKHTKAVIFRQEAKQLRDIIERSRELIGDEGRFNENNLFWRDLPDGGTLEFGGLGGPEDIRKWRGRAHDLKVFDEATEFEREVVEMALTWNRTSKPGQKCRALLAFNPPSTPEGEWVLDYFAPWLDPEHENPAKPGELRWFARVAGKDVMMPDGRSFMLDHGKFVYDFDPAKVDPTDVLTPKSRTFFPARVTDNPYLMASGYVSRLQALPEPLRTQMLKGVFDMVQEEDVWQFISLELVVQAQLRWQETRPDDAVLLSLGVDCARGGRDNATIQRLYGGTREGKPVLWFAPVVKIPGEKIKTGQDLASEVVLYYEEGAAINVDVVGIGSSPYDALCEHFGDQAANIVFPINNGAGAPKQKMRRHGKNLDVPATDLSGRIQFPTFRSYSFWQFKELLEGKNVVDRFADPKVVEEISVELPPDRELKADLCVAKWSMRTGKAFIEGKEDIKGRLPARRSPDVGDAAILATVNRGLKLVQKRKLWVV